MGGTSNMAEEIEAVTGTVQTGQEGTTSVLPNFVFISKELPGL
jgi:hypothetical protein